MFLIHAAQIAENYCYLFQSIKNLCKTVDVKNVRPKLLYTLKSSTCHARYRRIFSFTKAIFFFNFCIRPKVIEKNLWRKNQSFDETASITKLRVANQLTLDERYCKTINDWTQVKQLKPNPILLLKELVSFKSRRERKKCLSKKNPNGNQMGGSDHNQTGSY